MFYPTFKMRTFGLLACFPLIAATAAQAAVINPDGSPDTSDANLKLLLQAGTGITAGGTTVGSTVSRWQDQVSATGQLGDNSGIATAAIDANLVPNYTLFNGETVVGFTALDTDGLALTGGTSGGDPNLFRSSAGTTTAGDGALTIIAAVRPSNVSGAEAFISANNSWFGVLSNQLIFQGRNSGTTDIRSQGVVVGGEAAIFVFRRTGPTSNQFFYNGTEVALASGTTTGTLDQTSTPGLGVNINTSGSLSFHLDGQIGEIMVYHEALSAADQNLIGGYLSAKYDIDTAYPAIPEPGSMGLLLLGASVMMFRRR